MIIIIINKQLLFGILLFISLGITNEIAYAWLG